MKFWLDDERPAPIGFTSTCTVNNLKDLTVRAERQGIKDFFL